MRPSTKETSKAKAERYLKKLKDKLEYYKRVAIDSSDAIIIQDFKGVVKAWNKSAEKIYGFKEKEMLGQNITKIIAKENRAEAIRNISSIKKGKPSFRVSQTRLTKDGKKIDVNITYSPIFENEEIIEIATTEMDVSGLKKLLEEAQMREKQLKFLNENTSDVVFNLSVRPGNQYRFEFANPAFFKVTGLKVNQVIGKLVSEVIPKPSLSLVFNNYRKAITEKKKISWEEITHYPAGDKTGYVSINPVFDKNGACKNLVGTVYDITEKKLIEEENKKDFSLLESTMNSTADGILVIDRQGKVEFSNKKFEELWKIPANLIKFKDDKKLLDYVVSQLSNPKEFLNKVNYLYAHPKEISFDVFGFKDGRIFERYSRPQYLGADITGRVWSFRDISERKKAEDILRETQENLVEAQKNAQIGNWTWNLETGELWWSEENYRIYGLLKKIKPTIESFMATVEPSDVKKVEKAIQDALANKKPYDIYIHSVRLDGAKIIVNAKAKVIFNKAGKALKMLGTVQDVTEKKKYEEEITNLAKFPDENPNPVFRISKDNILMYRNSASLPLIKAMECGCAPGKKISRQMAELIAPAIKSKNAKTSIEVKVGKKTFLFTVVPFIKNEYTNLYGTDITAIKEAEIKLKQNEEKYRVLAESSPDCIKLFDLKGRLLFMNKGGMEEHYLKNFEEVRKWSVVDSIVEKDREKFKKAFADALEGKITEIEVRHTKQGSKREFCMELIAPVKDNEGKVVSVFGVSRNITESRKIGMVLRENEEKYRNVVENANETILVAQDGKFKYVNSKVFDLLGYKPGDLIGKNFVDYIHPEDQKMVAERYVKRLKGIEVPAVYPFRVMNKKGNTRWVQINAVRIDWQDKPATLNFLTDITEAHESEELIKKSSGKLQEKVEELERFKKLTVGRELKMVELKEQIARLKGKGA